MKILCLVRFMMSQVTWVSKINLRIIETDMYVESMLKRWKLAVGEDQVENEAVARVRADVILLNAVLAERAEMQQMLETKPDPSSKVEIENSKRDPHLYFETPFKMRVIYEGKSRELTGKADYSVGYLQGGSSSGNLICVEAKRRRDLGKAHGQLLAYMGLLRFPIEYGLQG